MKRDEDTRPAKPCTCKLRRMHSGAVVVLEMCPRCSYEHEKGASRVKERDE